MSNATFDNIEAARNDGFNSGTIAALACVTAQDSSVLWGEIVRAAGTQQILVHALTHEGDWEWGGFSKYVKTELPRGSLAAAKRAIKTATSKKVSS